ncbi:hypothetical protein BTVI_02458 [Pitangus sulphuratus]|nr:hypothetical protein BTVI_02458 [Pitangus sulphuratus]
MRGLSSRVSCSIDLTGITDTYIRRHTEKYDLSRKVEEPAVYSAIGARLLKALILQLTESQVSVDKSINQNLSAVTPKKFAPYGEISNGLMIF